MALTFCFFLRHDSVAERQQTEEGPDLWRAQLHRFHQLMVIERELWVGKSVPGEINLLCLL